MSYQRETEWGGTYDVTSDDPEITDGNFYAFTIDEADTVVSIATGGNMNELPSPAIDYRAYCNITGKQLVLGAIYSIPTGEIIKNFKLSAGKARLHRIARP